MSGKVHTNPKCQCICCKAKRGELKGKNSPNYGIRRTQQTKNKMRNAKLNKPGNTLGKHWKVKDTSNMKGHNGWNKGLTKETDKRIANAGKKQSITKQSAVFKKNNQVWNKGLSAKTNLKIKKAGKKIRKALLDRELSDLHKLHIKENSAMKGKIGANNPRFKGYLIKKDNYYYVWEDNKRIRRSRFVVEQFLKRKLKSFEIVHHLGEKYPLNSMQNKLDDRLINLYLFPLLKEHNRYHCLKNPPILTSNLIK